MLSKDDERAVAAVTSVGTAEPPVALALTVLAAIVAILAFVTALLAISESLRAHQ